MYNFFIFIYSEVQFFCPQAPVLAVTQLSELYTDLSEKILFAFQKAPNPLLYDILKYHSLNITNIS